MEDHAELLRAKYRARKRPNSMRSGALPKVVPKDASVREGKVFRICPVCKNEFHCKPDKLGQYRKVYCGSKCYNGRYDARDKGLAVLMGNKAFVKSLSRALYCPELNMSFSSMKKAVEILGISKRNVYDTLAGKPHPSGLTFVDYDFHKHPMPRHKLPW